MENVFRFVIEFVKISSTKGKKTVPVAYYDVDGLTYLPKADVLNTTLKEIEKKYYHFIKLYKSNGYNVNESLDWLFSEVWKYSIIRGNNLVDILSKDLKVKKSIIWKELINTCWFKGLIDFISKNARKVKKTNAVTYAECVRQVVELLGRENTLALLNTRGVKLAKTAIDNLSRLGGELPEIKQLVLEGKLKITVAWELPRVGGEERVKIAKELAKLKTYAEQRKCLKEIRRNLNKRI